MGDSTSTSAVAADMAAISKFESGQGDTPSSIESSPEPGAEVGAQDPAQPQKRKGGRKPIYATSEERKQRNRQAQAAFRERRTEYIKQLEAMIKQHEDALQSLQQSHRSAADECLMLRYKNSLLERILLEKGIDVQAELQVKTGSPALGPSYHPTTAAPSPLQRTAMNRQHARRSGQVMAPRALQGSVLAHPAHNEVTFSARSPPGGPTPSSHTSSPSAFSVKSPGMMPTTDTLTPPLSATQGLGPVQSQVQGQPQQYRPQQPQHRAQYAMQQPPQRPTPPPQYSGSSGMSSATSGSTRVGVMTGGSNNGYYTTPFQKHIDQLEQEYDSHPHLLPDADQDTSDQQSVAQSSEAGQYAPPTQYHQTMPRTNGNGMPQQTQQFMQTGQMQAPEGKHQLESSVQYPPMNQAFDSYDPMLDADPFGLSASMHFPTSYSIDQAPQR